MKRVAVLALAAATVIPFTARAQSKPDFSGTWTMDAAKSDPAPQGRGGGGGGSRTIKQSATELSVTTEGRGGPQTMVYKLDGSASTNKVMGRGGEQEVKSMAKWDGSSLVIETTRDFQGTAFKTTDVYKMDGATMVVESTTPSMQGGETKRKTVWNKG
jgi:hypothetical protein